MTKQNGASGPWAKTVSSSATSRPPGLRRSITAATTMRRRLGILRGKCGEKHSWASFGIRTNLALDVCIDNLLENDDIS
jgi:hypothetical protein